MMVWSIFEKRDRRRYPSAAPPRCFSPLCFFLQRSTVWFTSQLRPPSYFHNPFFSSSSWRARGFTANFPLEWENTRGSFRYFLPRPTWAKKKKCFHHIFFANTKPSIKLILHFFSGFPETLWKNKFCVIPSKPYVILIPSQRAPVFSKPVGA